jgi:hypothetical protein
MVDQTAPVAPGRTETPKAPKKPEPGTPGSATSDWDREHEPNKVPPSDDDPTKAPE